jgi:microsomal dipeptidase-like Zn-dependent dipeptidase
MAKWIGGFVALAAIIGAVLFFFVIPARVDANYNRVVAHEPYPVSAEAAALHKTLRVADLHADSLLWMRDPLKRHNRGQVDLPRLVEGGFRLQVFSAVTKAPKNLNYDRNTGDTDNITPLAIAQRWPVGAWSSLAERALYQAERLHRAERLSAAELDVVITRDELAAVLEGGGVAAVLATEGAHPLEGDLANLDRLYEAGYRVLGLQHFFDNELGGSLHGVSNSGLSEFGQEAVVAAQAKGMIIDVAHSSEKVARDVLAMSPRPLIVSHTGMKGHCDNARNVSDELLKDIAAAGGLVGIGFWDGAACASTLDAVASAIVYAVETLGPEHVALGSDFDGTVTTPFDASEMPALTSALMAKGLDAETIRLVMGENQIRFFLENLPED